MIHDLAALACALCFAFASLAFASAGRMVGSTTVNQTRILIAAGVLALVHLARTGALWPTDWTGEETQVLALSGVIGLAVGDQCYFFALTVVGPRLGTLLMSTFPLFAVLGDGVLRGSWPAPLAALWFALCGLGVVLVLSERRDSAASLQDVSRGRYAFAIVCGLLGALGQGLGLALTSMAEGFRPDVAMDPVSMTLVRMVAGLCIVLLLTQGSRWLGYRRRGRGRAMTRVAFWTILAGVAFGPTLGVWLSMVAVQSPGGAGRASVLIALTPIMMIPIVWLRSSERPGLVGWIGTLLAFFATAALMWGQQC